MTSEPSTTFGTDPFDDIMLRLRDGDRDAAELVWRRFVGPLLAVAHRHLNASTRQKIDPDDVVQSAYRTFFVRYAKGQFDLADWSSLWGLLARITVRKCGRKVAFFRAQQRDVHREVASSSRCPSSFQDVLVGSECTPDETAAMLDTVEHMMSCVSTPEHRRIILRLLEGADVATISGEVGRSEYTVRRVGQRLRRHLSS